MNDQYPYVGLAAYFDRPVSAERTRLKRIAQLLIDRRWPGTLQWVSCSASEWRLDPPPVRVVDTDELIVSIKNYGSRRLCMLRERGASVHLELGHSCDEWQRWEAPLQLAVTCPTVELTPRASEAWISLAHDLVAELGAVHAIVGIWPTCELALHDTWRSHAIVDTPFLDGHCALPADYAEQVALLKRWRLSLGKTYVRHPRWGTYLRSAHVAALGGVERIRAVVGPARIEPVSDLTYIQLTDSIDTGLTTQAVTKRLRLQQMMTPLLLGAGRTELIEPRLPTLVAPATIRART